MKRTLLITTLAGLALVWLRPAHSQAAEAVWVQHYDGPGNDLDVATAVALDTNGNVFVTGYSTGSGGDYDYTTIKYSGAGVPLWTNRYNGPGNGGDQAHAVAVDTNGNVFVTGNASSASSSDFGTIKYSNAGMPLWTNRYNGPGNNADGAGAIALDTSGNVFVTGYSLGVKIGNVDPSFDFATVKYSGAGVPLWTNRYDGPGHGDDYPFALAVDSSGNVIVTGRARGGNFWPDYATIKYSAAGVPLWTNRFNGGGDALDEAAAVAVDTNGNVFVTGQSWGSGGNSDYTTIKYSGAGVPVWTNYYNGLPSGDDYATAMALDSSGNVYVTGYSFRSGPGWGYGTVAYSGEGVPLWMNWHSGPGVTIGLAKGSVAADGRGNVFVTGYSPGIDSGYDYLIIRYSVLPSLTVARTKTNTVAVSWPSPSTGFTLQQNTNGIATVNWSNVLTLPTDNGTTKTFIVNPPSGTSFFRLKSQ